MKMLLNLIAFQIGWFVCVFGAAWGYPWAGPAYVVLWVGIHIALSSEQPRELGLAIIAAAWGYAADSLLVLLGQLSFPDYAQVGAPSTIWMAAMWVNFAATLNSSLKWLHHRWLLCIIFGAIGGPLAYYGGMKFGAVMLGDPLLTSLFAVAVVWAVSTPLLVAAAIRLDRTHHGDAIPSAGAVK